jgi:predicted CXXCH cytochrome family protein
MYRRGVTCFDCHHVHGTSNYAQLRKPANALCLDCHGPSSPNGPRTATIEQHTHHKEGSAGSQCVSCHMPAIETEGPANTTVHAHTFRFVTPAMTDKYKIANPCGGSARIRFCDSKLSVVTRPLHVFDLGNRGAGGANERYGDITPTTFFRS